VRGHSLKARKIASTVLTLAILGGAGYFIYTRYVVEKPAPIEYKTAAVERGRITATVTASGTLSPLKTVQVGSQVSGKILELNADFNSQVKKGDLLAKLDPSLLESDKLKAKANLLSAQASLTRAIADRDNAKSIYDRTKSLADSKVVAQQEVDAAYVAYKSAKASVETAQASVSVAKAAIETVAVNLTYTTIISPIDGVVISRDVSVGQTVAASLSAPTLFTIAEDLRQMEVHTNVAESDVGALTQDMKVNFTVDAYPTERFRGVVQQIRNSPQTVSNVVTYDAVVRVVNDELKLRPGMTASVTFNVQDRRDVILIPNGALRFTPSDPAIAALAPQPKSEGRGEGGRGEWKKHRDAEEAKTDPAAEGDARAPEGDTKIAEGDVKSADTRSADNKSGGARVPEGDAKVTDARAQPGKVDEANTKTETKSADAASETRPADDAAKGDDTGRKRRRGGGGASSTERTVWILENGAPKPLQVQIGISDGSKTEIVGGELKEGDQIITGQTGGEVAKADAPAASPFNTGGSKGGGAKGGGRRGGF
jgi:HlyD family secretion protein